MSYYFSKTLSVPFDDGVSRVTDALKEEGFGIITEIDVKETFKKKIGAEFRNYRILERAARLRPTKRWNRVPGYIAAQTGGGLAAACFLRAMFGTAGSLGAAVPGPGFTNLQALIMEVLLTTGLVSTILGTASGARNIGSNGALAVGGHIALAGLWAAPVSGASMNPVRSFAPDLIRGDIGTTWIYVLGPLLGAIIAVGFETILKGKPTAAGTLAAQGDLEGGEDAPPH